MSGLLWGGAVCDSLEPCAEGPGWLALASQAPSVWHGGQTLELQKQSWQQHAHHDLPNQAWRVPQSRGGGQGRAGPAGPM